MRAIEGMLAIGALVCATACVPEGPPTSDADPQPKKPGKTKTKAKPKSSAPAVAPPEAPELGGGFDDKFERAEPGEDWLVKSPRWKIQNGMLCASHARNQGIWLRRRLPANVRIEFDAVSQESDLKVEVFGDGESSAAGATYDDATGYVLIHGGWGNRKHVLARLDEHGSDRLEIDVDPDSDDPRARPVEVDQPYHWRIERHDGTTLRWFVDDVLYFEKNDDEPLTGSRHEFMGFNDWTAPVCFDNVTIGPL